MELDQAHKDILSRLVQGESWKVVMRMIAARVMSHERQLRALTNDTTLRLVILERRNELLDFVARVYQQSREENPFDLAASALWSTDLKLPESQTPELSEEELQKLPLEGFLTKQRKRIGGSVT